MRNDLAPAPGRCAVWKLRVDPSIMDSVELNERLSRINTLWTKVLRAHGDDTVAAQDAKCVLLEHQRAVYRYLQRAMRT